MNFYSYRNPRRSSLAVYLIMVTAMGELGGIAMGDRMDLGTPALDTPTSKETDEWYIKRAQERRARRAKKKNPDTSTQPE